MHKSLRGLVICLITVLVPVPASAQVPNPLKKAKEVLEDNLPSLSAFLEPEPAITTSLDDALTEIPYLDDYEPAALFPLAMLGPSGTVPGATRLIPGTFGFSAQSYCLHAGTYGPGEGDGYLYAPLVGSRAAIIRSVLQNSVDHPEIPQRDIQVLIWAILSRTKISDMSHPMQRTAATLLTPREFAALEGGALGLVPDEVMRRAMRELPPAARQVFQAEAQLRRMLTSASSSYEDLERVAVLAGNPALTADSRPVPQGRWSYHPDGYFVRFFPSGYSRTTVHVAVPGGATTEYDASGRLVAIRGWLEKRIEFEYGATDVAVDGDPDVHGYTLHAVRVTLPGRPDPELFWEHAGWTLTGLPRGRGHPATGMAGFEDLPARYRAAVGWREEWREFHGPADARTLFDVAHVQQALRILLARQDAPEDVVAAVDELLTQAWLTAFCQAAGGCPRAAPEGQGRTGGAGWRQGEGPVLDLSGTVAVPGNRGRQRLAQSHRCRDEDWSNLPQGLGRPGDPVMDGVLDGFRDSGYDIEPEQVVVSKQRAGTHTILIRLDVDGCLLPGLLCIEQAIELGEVPEGSIQGARTMIVGMIQHANGRTRVTVRTVDVETGIIHETGKGDADGTGQEAIAEAMANALAEHGLTCSRQVG